MTKQLAQFLADAAEHNGNETDIRPDYSGRGMFGRTTYAVVVDDYSQLITDLLQYLKDCPDYAKRLEQIEIDSLRRDSMGMGRGIVVY